MPSVPMSNNEWNIIHWEEFVSEVNYFDFALFNCSIFFKFSNYFKFLSKNSNYFNFQIFNLLMYFTIPIDSLQSIETKLFDSFKKLFNKLFDVNVSLFIVHFIIIQFSVPFVILLFTLKYQIIQGFITI